MTREEEERRGIRANALMNDDLMVEAFATVEKALKDRWLQCKDRDERDRIWMSVHILGHVHAHLTEVMKTGKLASLDLEEKRNRTRKSNG